MSFTLDERHAEFILRPHTSVAVASRAANNVPSLFKAAACRVSPDRRRVTLYVDQQLAASVLRDLRAGSPVAAVFTEPGTHRSIQLKGERADIGSATPADREYARERIESVVVHLTALRYPEAGVRCYFHFVPEQLIAVSFTPTAAFEQTPGPGAGTRLDK
ncbi:MAG: hypothetical protein ACM3PU_13355 [Gemmatimonadota bacterium]